MDGRRPHPPYGKRRLPFKPPRLAGRWCFAYAKREAVPLHERSCLSGKARFSAKKAHGQNDRAQHSHLGFGNGKTNRHRRITYLTYPVHAGITVTFSRGLSPHSAAGPAFALPARRPLSSLVEWQYSTGKPELQGRRPGPARISLRRRRHIPGCGQRHRKCEPFPGRENTTTCPPHSFTTRRTMDRPSPFPRSSGYGAAR